MCLLGCGDARAPLLLAVRVHQFRGSCALSTPTRGSLTLQALGDFEPGNDAAEVLRLDDVGAALRFPAATQAVLGQTTSAATTFSGYGERRANEGLDLLLWPDRTCAVAGGGYPGQGGGQALGFAAASSTLLVAGGKDAFSTRAIVGALTVDTTTGELRELDGDGRLQLPRAFASVSSFGSGLLVAGGQKPVAGVPELELDIAASAEVFEPGAGRFDRAAIELQNARSRHAAVVLNDGRTLLVGGRSKVGSVSLAQYQLEIVDPVSRRATIGEAITPRIDPTALRLTDGRIFVGGGTKLDGSLSAPIGEWLSPDGGPDPTLLSLEVPARFDRAFTTLLDGAVLAVGGCEDRVPTSDADQATCKLCSNGCRPLEDYDAWWITPDGAASVVTLPGISAPRPHVFRGTDGSPWLIAATSSDPETPRLFRFNPWARSFQPARLPVPLTLPLAGAPILSLAPDTLVWVDDRGAESNLLGLRLGARSRFARDLALVRSSEPDDPARPRHLVPTRPLDPEDASASYDGELALHRPDVAIAVPDTDYADITIKLRVRGKRLPRVLLGATALGGDDCPWPDGSSAGGDDDLPTIVRRGTRVQLRYHGAQSAPCEVEPGRLSVALSAGRGTSIVTELEIQRDGAR